MNKIKKTNAWKSAEDAFEWACTSRMMSLPGMSLSLQEYNDKMKRISKDCPEFYPAIMEVGFRQLARGQGKVAEQKLEHAFHLLLQLAEPEKLSDELEIFIDNLEKLWRFDILKQFLTILIQKYPHEALYYDYLACAEVHLGNIESAQILIQKAVAMKPENSFFLANLGWIHQVAGNYQEAGIALQKALKMKPDDQIIQGNLEINKYLEKHGGNFVDYLVRPVDFKKLEKLSENEDWGKTDELAASYNGSRMDAMKWYILREKRQKLATLADSTQNLMIFFDFIKSISQEAYFLYEDISFVQCHFKNIMHKFIFKFGDIDEEIFISTLNALLEFYSFLSHKKLISTNAFRLFKKDVNDMKGELIDKMQKYNKIRHNPAVNEDEKETLREELFEGDHCWPFI